MNSSGVRNVNWHECFRKQLDSWNKGGVHAIPYDYKEGQYDPNYFKQYWQSMLLNGQIEEKQPENKDALVPDHVVFEHRRNVYRVHLGLPAIPSVTIHDKEQTLLLKENVLSDKKLVMLEMENKELWKDVHNLGRQIGSLVEMITSGFNKFKGTKRPSNKETLPSQIKRRFVCPSESSSDIE